MFARRFSFRVFAAFFLAMIIGSAIGIVMGRKKKLDDYFDGGLKSFLSLMTNIYVYLVALLSTIALIILGMF